MTGLSSSSKRLLNQAQSPTHKAEKIDSELRAQHIINLVNNIKRSIKKIEGYSVGYTEGDDERSERIKCLQNDQKDLSELATELSTIFRDNQGEEQENFIKKLIARDTSLWDKGIEDGVDYHNRSITKIINSWELFDALPPSKPAAKYHNIIIEDAVIVREKVVLAIYGITMHAINKAFQKRI